MMVVAVFIFVFLFNVFNINCQNIVGCGGFVKSDIKDFSFQKLSANLVFPDGTVNYITDILPNGAFSIPVYDFGEYILKVVGPKGWTIEPSNGYNLIVDGQDSCNDDYNFKFSGFSIYGKVSTANINQGPSGIRIDLYRDGNLVTFTSTIEGGDFVINNLMPGKYEINFQSKTIEGKTIEFTDIKYDVEIKNDNVYIEDSFIIHGYPVFGDIHFDNEALMNVQFYIFSKSLHAENFNFTKYKCLKFDRNDLKWENFNPLCKSVSNENGEFVFPLLPGGEYLLVPIYELNNSTFNISPSSHEFQITSHSVDLRNHFKISGFSVNGKIMIPNSDIGLPNSEVYVDKNLVTKSNSNGDFIINSGNKGFHELSITADGYIFKTVLVQFDFKNPNIGNFYPEKIRICGAIIIDTNHVSANILNDLLQPRKIVLINESNGEIVDSILTSSKSLNEKDNNEERNKNAISRFCFYAIPDTYIIKPLIDSAITLSLAPNQIKVQLKSKPITVKFSQFRGTISGHVKCIERCNTGEFEVTLKSTDENNESSHLIQHILISESIPNEGTFKFQDIVPGNYQLELISANGHFPSYKNRWCWSDTVLPVTMIDENINSGLIFEQTGFSMNFHLSHDMKVDYVHVSEDENRLSGSKSLMKGVDRICLPQAGVFELHVDTCHRLVNNTILVNTSSGDLDREISLNVVQYKVKIALNVATTGPVALDEQELDGDVKGLITLNLNSDPVTKSIDWDVGTGQGTLEFWVEPDTSIQVSVVSHKYLVRPDKMNFQLSHGTSDCVTDIGKFELEPGTFIVGSVSPGVMEVAVEVVRVVASGQEEEHDGAVVATIMTDDQGHFSVGPFPSAHHYEVRLSKQGYKFSKSTTDNTEYQFVAIKLARLDVEVVDEVTGSPLSGIFLSIIGDGLRRNEHSDESGRFAFVGLTAGTYYLRPMMKELDFSPSGAIAIIVEQGKVDTVRITAKRTAFSIYGKVVSLNGEAEPGVTVEAEPVRDGGSGCQWVLARSEHGVSDDSGTFRIRGLVPKCRYRLSLKIASTSDDPAAIVRSHPRSVTVEMANEDVHNVKLYGLRSLNFREIAAMVYTNNDAYLASLHISVFPSGNPDNVVSVFKFLPDNVYFQMSLPQVQRRTEYVIRLQSNLSPRLYSNISAQEYPFIVEPGTKTFFKYFKFDFYPTKNAIGDSDVTMTMSSSVLLPLLLVTLALIFYKKDSLHPVVGQLLAVLARRLSDLFTRRGPGTNSSSTSGSGNSSSSMQGATVLDAADISDLNSAIAKPKLVSVPVTVKKPPFWLRPKKA